MVSSYHIWVNSKNILLDRHGQEILSGRRESEGGNGVLITVAIINFGQLIAISRTIYDAMQILEGERRLPVSCPLTLSPHSLWATGFAKDFICNSHLDSIIRQSDRQLNEKYSKTEGAQLSLRPTVFFIHRKFLP